MENGWEIFFERMIAFLEESNEMEFLNEAYLHYATERLEICIDCIVSLDDVLQSRPVTVTEEEHEIAISISSQFTLILQYLRELHSQWSLQCDEFEADVVSTSYSAPLIHSSQPGRPRMLITPEQLCYLRSLSFSWVQISQILGVSYMTIYRRRNEFGITEMDRERQISDDELQNILQQEFPAMGQTMVWGHLRSMGYRITRERVRNAMRQNDPIHNALRWQGDLVQRRPYSVPGPNSLWHIGEVVIIKVYS